MLIILSVETHPVVLPVAAHVSLDMHHATAAVVTLDTTSIQMDHACHVSHTNYYNCVPHAGQISNMQGMGEGGGRGFS